MDHGSEIKLQRDLVCWLESSKYILKKTLPRVVKRGTFGSPSHRAGHRVALRVNICTYLQHTGCLKVNIYIFTHASQVYVQFVHNYNNTRINYVHLYIVTKLTGVGRVLPQYIFGEAHYIQYLQA